MGFLTKEKRRRAGTPGITLLQVRCREVLSLSPKILLELEQYACEICNQGFQRDQNLQMHLRDDTKCHRSC
ncbi:putative transcription factor C2H2 family [Helianthus annuus]|nr:putative transcription factor C2H2 family [Helianthus annuus]